MEVMLNSSPPQSSLAVRKAVQVDMRCGELDLALIGFINPESWPSVSPEQHKRTDPGDRGSGEPARRAKA